MNNNIPTNCPSCNETLLWNKNETDLICDNNLCDAQLERNLSHFFSTIENIDGFGPATIKILVDNGIEKVSDIYALETYDFSYFGFGLKTSTNLKSELFRSMDDEIEDWRFLAAFGCRTLGKGNSKKLLKEYDLLDIFNLDEDDIMNIEGFGQISSENIIEDLIKISDEFNELYELFNIKFTEPVENIYGIISGKTIVFTGKMDSNRKFMQEQAEKLGAIIGSGVSSKTDILVTGANVGASKISKAEKFGTKVISEDEYYELIR